jgi:toxoflavin biosynthesis protein ToxD
MNSLAPDRPHGFRLPGSVRALAFIAAAVGCHPGLAAEDWRPRLIQIPAGAFVMGSDAAEREYAYRLDEAAYGSPVTRAQRWYEGEAPRGTAETGAYFITATPVTNRQYAAFVRATGHHAPDVDRATWDSYGLIHPYERTRRHAWVQNRPPAGREDHPVVLVSRADADAYSAWLSRRTGQRWRLPTEAEWEKSARGSDGRYFPWGNDYDPAKLNSHDRGPFDTQPVGSYPQGATPFRLLDAAGQVYEWTATRAGDGNAIVKGGSWDDKGCGVCRPAARHGRPAALKHILIGIRLVREA